MVVLYAFMRLTDDLADTATSPLACRRQSLTRWSGRLVQTLDNTTDPAAQSDPNTISRVHPEENVFPALKQVCQRFDIPREYLLRVIDGVTSDLVPCVQMKTLDEALLYCDRVAGAVGMATLAVFGCDKPIDTPDIQNAAIACGRAFQWTNFLRDIGEDLKADRVYFPLSDFESVGLSLETFKSIPDPGHTSTLAFFRLQHERVHRFFEESASLLDHVNRDSRDVYNLMRQRYRLVFETLRNDNFQAFYRRVRLSPWRKTKLVAECLLSTIKSRFIFSSVR